MTPTLVKGSNLTPAQRREVLAAFVHRHMSIGPDKPYTSDDDWVKQHAFYIKKDGHLADSPKRCEPVYLAD